MPLAHLDALGFRYYIPVVMLSVIDRYESSNLRVIGTLKDLYPKKAMGGNIKQTYRDLAEKLTGSRGQIVNSQQLSAT